MRGRSPATSSPIARAGLVAAINAELAWAGEHADTTYLALDAVLGRGVTRSTGELVSKVDGAASAIAHGASRPPSSAARRAGGRGRATTAGHGRAAGRTGTGRAVASGWRSPGHGVTMGPMSAPPLLGRQHELAAIVEQHRPRRRRARRARRRAGRGRDRQDQPPPRDRRAARGVGRHRHADRVERGRVAPRLGRPAAALPRRRRWRARRAAQPPPRAMPAAIGRSTTTDVDTNLVAFAIADLIEQRAVEWADRDRRRRRALARRADRREPRVRDPRHLRSAGRHRAGPPTGRSADRAGSAPGRRPASGGRTRRALRRRGPPPAPRAPRAATRPLRCGAGARHHGGQPAPRDRDRTPAPARRVARRSPRAPVRVRPGAGSCRDAAARHAPRRARRRAHGVTDDRSIAARPARRRRRRRPGARRQAAAHRGAQREHRVRTPARTIGHGRGSRLQRAQERPAAARFEHRRQRRATSNCSSPQPRRRTPLLPTRSTPPPSAPPRAATCRWPTDSLVAPPS